MTREEFLVYMEAMNNVDHEKMSEFITDDIVLEFYNKPTNEKQTRKIVRGRDEYLEHFKRTHEKVKEILELGFFLYDGTNMIVEIYVEFHPYEDVILNTAELKKGQAYCATHWLCYDFAPDGRFNRIRIAHHLAHDGPPKHHPDI